MNTRIAPSPTGFIHLGNIRTAYHNYLAAKSSGGKFVLRIDDTDLSRSKSEYVDKIVETLEWLGLNPDESYKQNHRFGLYEALALKLKVENRAKEENGAIILDARDFLSDEWTDEVCGKIKISAREKEIAAKIVLVKSDGSPAYNFCSIVDDCWMGITDVIRGNDHISNTAKQLAIIKALGYNYEPKFHHEGLIFQNGRKLSKREQTGDLDFYRQNGYSPEAILNWVLRLGWSHPDPEFDRRHPIIPKDLAVKIFSEGKLRAANCSLDLKKLEWYNKQYH